MSLEPASNRWWSRVEPDERRAVGWATAWFFLILLGYFVVRPVRETMSTIGGTRQLQHLFLYTFLAMLVAVPIYSALVARLPRRWLVRVVFHFFAASLFGFFMLMRVDSPELQKWTARAFFIWVSVFGVFSTSIFWSVMADLFTSKQGRRLFGLIAAGGTAGAISGSLITSQLATQTSTERLLLIPTREVLFTVVDREDKYKSKSFIDTVVLRGGDMASGQIFGFLRNGLEIGLTALNLYVLPFVAIWAATAWQLGRRQQKLADERHRVSGNAF